MTPPACFWIPGFALAVLSGWAPIQAQSAPPSGASNEIVIPGRPEELRFPKAEYPSPVGERYRHELSNGLPIYVVEDHVVPIVDVVLALPTGEFLEPADRVGIASLTASLLRRGGSEKYPPDELDRVADQLAIEINSVGGLYRSGVILNCSPRVLEPALELMAEMVLRPRFDEVRVASAVANLSASLAERGSDPSRKLMRQWNRLMRPEGHFLTRQMTQEQLDHLDRSSLSSFHAQHWGSRGASIAVSGDVDTNQILESLEERFGAWPPGPEPVARASRATGPTRSSRGASSRNGSPYPPGIYEIPLRSVQGSLLLGHEGVLRSSWDDGEMFAVMVMNEVLGGGGAISRLLSRLRGREALVYQVQSSFGIGLEERGVFEVAVGVAPENAPRVAQIVVEEMERLRRAPPAELELELARRALIDGFPLLFESAEKKAGRFAEDALLGRPHSYWRQYRDGIRQITARDVRRVARRYLHPDRLRVLWLGPPLQDEEWAFLGLGGARRMESAR